MKETIYKSLLLSLLITNSKHLQSRVCKILKWTESPKSNSVVQRTTKLN